MATMTLPQTSQIIVTLEDNGAQHVFDLSGRPLNGKPTKAGVYVKNGKKVVIK